MKYATYVFDCDGVILASNAGKAEAFARAALPYGDAAAEAMVELHMRAGNITRRERWQRFFEDVLGRQPADGELDEALGRCTAEVLRQAAIAPEMPGILPYLQGLVAAGAKAVVVSGIETPELDGIIRGHDLGGLFSHVYGGPRGKGEILKRAIGAGAISLPAVYYGDGQDDYDAALGAGLDFVLVEGDSQWPERRQYLDGAGVGMIEDFRQLEVERRPAKLRVDAEGYVDNGEDRVYVGRGLAGAEVTLR